MPCNLIQLILPQEGVLGKNGRMVGVIVVNYNSGDEVLRLVASLHEQTITDIYLVVVDNSSPDGSGEKLRQQLVQAETLLSPVNKGFAAGVNLGIEHLRKKVSPPNYYWILNPDMGLSASALEALLDRAKLTQGIVGSKVLYPLSSDGQVRIWAAGGFVNIDRLDTNMRGNSELDSGQFEQSVSCDYVPGCSLFAPAKVFDEVGLLPEEYFLYFEETDWCLKAARKGYSVTYEPKSVVTHFFLEEKMSEPFVTYYYNRNRRVFFFKHLGLIGKIKLVWTTLFKDLPRARKSLTESPDEGYRTLFRSHVDSCFDFLFMRTGKRGEDS